jgi:hypothetical protein
MKPYSIFSVGKCYRNRHTFICIYIHYIGTLAMDTYGVEGTLLSLIF